MSGLFRQSKVSNLINVEDSTDKAEIVLGICEGEIEGLENGEKSFYVSDTPLMNVSGYSNFENFNLEILNGSELDNELNYYLGGATRNTSVGIELKYNTPIVRTTEASRSNVDFIEIRLVIQQLMSVGKKGTDPNTVKVLIEYKPQSSKEWKIATADGKPFVLKGKISGSTVQEFRIQTSSVNEPYEIRITKMSEDGDGEKTFNTISWESFQEGVTTAKSFPNTAIAHVYLQYSNQLTSVPSFYGIYKLLKIRVPSNYDPTTRTYSGEWDGTFKIAWSDNPAWCLYDFIMNDRYGVNAYSNVILDKWDCYEAGQWCDELVSDGKGGKEPRYTCNLVQTEATNGREFAIYLASLFNATLVEAATGYLRLFVEKDQDAVFLFMPENVTETGFSYTFTSPETRYNDIKVSFTNPSLGWESDTRRVYNQDDIDINGRVTYDFAAVGCIREGEALRRAYFKLITSLTEKVTVTFTTNRQAQYLSNFDVILIADPVLGYSLPGRMKSVSEDRKTVYLRDSIYLEAGVPYKIKINLPEGLYESDIEPVSGSGSLKEFTVKEALPDSLPEAAAFTIYGSERSGTPKPFRVISIQESEGNADQYVVTALELNRNKWDAADNMTFEGMGNYSGLPNINDIPHLLDASFFMTYNPTDLRSELIITPTFDTSYPYYSGSLLVYSKLATEDSWTQRTVIDDNIVIDHPAGDYEFKILPMSTTGLTPNFETAPIFKYTVEDTFDYPSNVKNLRVTRAVNGAQLNWDPVTDVDLYGYEVREGLDWETGEVITTNFLGTSIFVAIDDNKIHHYMVCAKNYREGYSQIPAYVSTSATIPDDVPAFYATVSQDRVRFDWTQVAGIDIEYEIRQGNNWMTGLKVARVKGNNTTVLLPSLPNVVYAIKAVSPAGLYSKNPRYTRPDTQLFSDRNIVKEIDNGAAGFPGITYGFEPLAYVEKALVMKQEFSRAEHYFPVNLEQNYRARNWLETEAFSYGSRLTWEDLHYRYSSTEAHISWINSQEMDSDGEIETLIMKKQNAEDYAKLYGFTYDNTTKDISGKIAPTKETNIAYADGRITQGLALSDTTYVEYNGNINVPTVFNMMFKVRVTDETDDNMNLITLVGESQNYMKIYVYNGSLYLRCSDHNDIIIPYKRAKTLDFLTIGISQSNTERLLYFFADYGNYEKYEEKKATPLGAFTQYYINRKLGEYL